MARSDQHTPDTRTGVAYLTTLPDGRTRVLHVDPTGALLEEQHADTHQDALAWARTVATRVEDTTQEDSQP